MQIKIYFIDRNINIDVPLNDVAELLDLEIGKTFKFQEHLQELEEFKGDFVLDNRIYEVPELNMKCKALVVKKV